jgi:hypothetical protein
MRKAAESILGTSLAGDPGPKPVSFTGRLEAIHISMLVMPVDLLMTHT